MKLFGKMIFSLLLFMTLCLPPCAQAADELEPALAAANATAYAQALSLYRVAAEQGNPLAQRISGLMLLYGEPLYGEQVHRDTQAARRYLEMAANQGDIVARYMLAKQAVWPEMPKSPTPKPSEGRPL